MGTTSLYKGEDNHGLTDKQLSFCEEYLIDSNGTRAAIAAGYSEQSASSKASTLLKLPQIVRYLGKIRKQQRKNRQIEAEEVIEQLWYCATRDPIESVDENGKMITNMNLLPPRARACIDSIEQTVHIDPITGEERINTKVKWTSKLQAIEMAMRHKGLFELSESGAIVDAMDWDELLERSEAEDELDTEIRLRIEQGLEKETIEGEVISSETIEPQEKEDKGI